MYIRNTKVLQYALDSFGKETFTIDELLKIVRETPTYSQVPETAIYHHILRMVDKGICQRVARGHYALTQKGMAIHNRSQRDRTAHAFLQEILNQKSEQDLIKFEIQTLQDKLQSLQNRSYEADARIDTLTTDLLEAVSQDN